MAVVVTPHRLSRQSEFYHQLGAMLSAGVAVMQALEHLHRSPPDRAFLRPLEAVMNDLTEGATFAEAVGRVRGWLPSFDLALIEAGEQSGRLDACCRLLADYYRERAQLARQVISDLMYPVFLLHAGVFIFPFASFFMSGNLFTYATQTLGVLLPLYAAAFLLILACQGRHGEKWRSLVEQAIHPIPILGQARRDLALARLAAALEALLNAGVPVLQGWELAATASGSPALRSAVTAWKPQLEAGETPADLLRVTSRFPELFSNLYHGGEISGKLDDTLRRLHHLYQEEASRKLKAVAQWAPRLIYFSVMIMIGVKVVGFWQGYFAQLDGVLK